MALRKNLYSDNELIILTEILDNKKISQRQLSHKLGLSLGTINVLINKMVKEGMIKMNHVSQNQVMYMLTPMGMAEKTKKTVSYLKSHYRVIYETKEKIKHIMSELHKKYENIIILKTDDEIGDIIEVAVLEYHFKDRVKVVNDALKISEYKNVKNVIFMHIGEDGLGSSDVFESVESFDLGMML
ncbi:winged helix-turn-helix transcriptional regulator [Helicovermis profundi]|uniref:Winged helix-turn-helix transcriptional regulator n=1 Tax=Helicovermis profundi TaxID=3065157 RepID=A0AAU9ESH7_9FIRM|nr:hypothetical protein HLPR_26970 [Clostridia bacterium S502]